MKIIILKGLPASGKTTWARDYQKKMPNTKRVNKDDLRAMLDNSLWSKQNEVFIVEMRDQIITECILAGYDVIVDDTNLYLKHEEAIRSLANYFNQGKIDGVNVEVEVKEFNTSLAECIRRDSQREGKAHVGEGVITNMYQQYVKPNQDKQESK